MLNERAVMEYLREASDNSIEIMKNIWLLLLPDNELESLQSEYNLLPSITEDEIFIKDNHMGKSVLYDQGVYKVIFDMYAVGKNKQTQVALPAYYSLLANRDRFGNQTLNPSTNTITTTIDNDLIFLESNNFSITINNYPINSVDTFKLQNIQNTIFTREVKPSESDIDILYSLDFTPVGGVYSRTNNKLVFRDMFTDSSDYFNTYFRDYFYTNFASDYQMEMSYEYIIPNMTQGMLFNRQFYAYAKGGNFYFTQFSNSKILSYGSKMWWTGDHFIFKKGVEDSIDLNKAGRYFSFDLSTGEEGQTPASSFLNIHLAGEYLDTKGGNDCFTIADNTSTDYQLNRNLMFLGDYSKNLDVHINNRLYFGEMGNWIKTGDYRKYPASIHFSDDNRQFNFTTPSSTFFYWFGADVSTTDVDTTDGKSYLSFEHHKNFTTLGEVIELKSYSLDGDNRLPIVINGQFNPATNDIPRYQSHAIPYHTKTMVKSGNITLGYGSDGVYYNSVLCVTNWATNEESGSIQTFYVTLPPNPKENEIITIWVLDDVNQVTTPNEIFLEVDGDEKGWFQITTTTRYIYSVNNEWRLVE